MHCFNILFFFQNHVAQCQFATVPCLQCQKSVRKRHLEEHITAECQRRPVSCPDCVACFVYEEREVPLTHSCHCSRIVLPAKLLSFTVYQWGLVSLQSGFCCSFSFMSSSVPLPVSRASTVRWISSETRWVSAAWVMAPFHLGVLLPLVLGM